MVKWKSFEPFDEISSKAICILERDYPKSSIIEYQDKHRISYYSKRQCCHRVFSLQRIYSARLCISRRTERRKARTTKMHFLPQFPNCQVYFDSVIWQRLSSAVKRNKMSANVMKDHSCHAAQIFFFGRPTNLGSAEWQTISNKKFLITTNCT